MRTRDRVVMAAILLVFAAGASAGQRQYKRFVRDAVALVVQGRLDAAQEKLEQTLSLYPGDGEALFGMALVFGQRGQLDSALACAKRAVAAGVPPGRFWVGPRDLLQPLFGSRRFRQWLKTQAGELVHGPMIGDVTDSSAAFWVRTAEETTVELEVSADSSFRNVCARARGRSTAERDFTAVLRVTGLRPSRRYFYRVRLNDGWESTRWTFRTFPATGRSARFRLAFGGGAGYTPWHERMWDTIRGFNPVAFLFLGDNVYIDHPTMPDVQRYCYYRRQSRPEYRRFVAGTAIFAIWDDHDFCTNDGWGGPNANQPPWKRQVWRVFRENWVNPGYGGGQTAPGCWFRFSVADVDFFLLDCRFYRTDPRGQNPSMLGPVQKRWLLNGLASSRATFKVLVSSVPWAFGTKPGSLDTWEGYKQEREEIFSFIARRQIEGVLLLSADRHRSDVWKIKRPDAYDLYEFESSKLTNIHTHKLMPDALFGYNAKCSFGLLDFDTERADPEVTYRIVNIDGEVVYSFTVSKTELSF